MFSRILVAVDDSTLAGEAFAVARDLATRLSAELALAHVVTPGLANPEAESVSAEMLRPSTEEEAMQFLAGYRMRAAAPAGVDLVGIGAPAAEIVRLAHAWSADLIVLGTHGRGPIRRALLGSVADGVVRHAHCPVLVVPPK